MKPVHLTINRSTKSAEIKAINNRMSWNSIAWHADQDDWLILSNEILHEQLNDGALSALGINP